MLIKDPFNLPLETPRSLMMYLQSCFDANRTIVSTSLIKSVESLSDALSFSTLTATSSL